MLFNSYEFIFLYLPIVLGGFFLLARVSTAIAATWLAVASLFFYGWWNPKFVALLLGSIVCNYLAGYLLANSTGRRQRAVLIAAVAGNLALLAVFKYANFFISTVNSAGASFGLLDLVLPLGISFFTFTQIAFLVDAYRGIAREYRFVHYLLFVTWFPHLIAGPVLHHKQMMPQFSLPDTYRPNAESIAVGLIVFSIGLVKKVLLADQFALYANPFFDSASTGLQPDLAHAWAGALAYTLQLYFDFSGYSDMAIGLSRMFNVKLPLNFDSPYRAASIIDFWRRWHMTLSAFLRDYLYVPLGGNRKGPMRRQINLLTTMLLGGLWHGAGWNFVLWGGLHGVYLVGNHAWRWLTGSTQQASTALGRAAATMLTFVAVVFAWVPFRATSIDATVAVWRGMSGLNGVGAPSGFQLVWLALGMLIVWCLPNTQQWLANLSPAWDSQIRPSRVTWQPDARQSVIAGLVAGCAFVACVLSFNRFSPFLYFQF